jgi:hypothetical protein
MRQIADEQYGWLRDRGLASLWPLGLSSMTMTHWPTIVVMGLI